MAIDCRNSSDRLHQSVILSKITEYDIFVYYCPSFKEIGKKFLSDLRNDKSPTVAIVLYSGRLIYKDFGESDHVFNCFDYIKYKYNCSFIDVLRIIDCDFNLKLSPNIEGKKFTMGAMGYNNVTPDLVKPAVIISKKRRHWNSDDVKFWKKYLVSKKTLSMFAVEPISHFWVNAARFTCNSISYAFKFKNRYKIYSPYETSTKWLSNTTKADIQGFDQLPESGNRLIITSSLKDVMCLHAAGYNAIAMQSEMQMPTEKLISELKERFTTIEILYDNDFDKESNPGQTMAKKICDLYGFNNICIPSEFKSKDPSDLIDKVGNFNELKNILNEQRRDHRETTDT
jgi:hypothetical protein